MSGFHVGDIVVCVKPYKWAKHLLNRKLEVTKCNPVYSEYYLRCKDIDTGEIIEGAHSSRFRIFKPEVQELHNQVLHPAVKSITITSGTLLDYMSLCASTMVGHKVNVLKCNQLHGSGHGKVELILET